MDTFFESGYPRQPNDLYETPEWVTRILPRHVDFDPDGVIVEPAAGAGKLARELQKETGCLVASSDICPLHPDVRQKDFLANDGVTLKRVVTNPPFSLANEFVNLSLIRTNDRKGMVAMLLPVNWDCAAGRSGLFSRESPFLRKITITKRIVWFDAPTPPGEKKNGPKHHHAWYIWDWTKPAGQEPTTRYDQ